eukprot:TRINITY_DN3097_c0_g1_i1.p1 TRINITY_DN3097_c0_g1~~TRINITY_DN3097_c0_g1_i1.p1  ORF type:complete len:799 (+),score=184.79 TRINITY_DN3097_c0_g1_i1:83-2479(+)
MEERAPKRLKLAVVVNCFQAVTGLKEIHQYSMECKPYTDSYRFRYFLLKNTPELANVPIHMAGEMVFTGKLLPLNQPKSLVLHTKTKTGEEFEITLAFAKTVPFQNSMEMYHILNTGLKRIMNAEKFVPVGRGCFTKMDERIQLRDIFIDPGYSVAFKSLAAGTLLQVQRVFKAVQKDNANTFLKTFHRGDEDEMRANVIGRIVRCPHNNMTYRIDDIDFSLTPESTFNKRVKGGGEETITYGEYYKRVHNLQITDRKQPMLVVTFRAKRDAHNLQQRKLAFGGEAQKDNAAAAEPPKSRTIHLVPEICYFTGLNPSQRSDQSLKMEMTKLTKLSPADRFGKIQDMVARVFRTQDSPAAQELQNWQLHIEPRLMSVPCKNFEPENVIFRDNEKVNATETANWQQFFRNKVQFLKSQNTKKWLLFRTRPLESQAKQLEAMLDKTAEPFGFHMGHAVEHVVINADKPVEWENALKNKIDPSVSLVVVLVPNDNKERYNAVKRVIFTERPVASQVIVSKKLEKNMQSVVTKIVQQISTKLGGHLWKIHIPIEDTPTMLVGIDVSPMKGRARKSQALGYVATMDDQYIEYHSDVAIVGENEDRVDKLVQVFKNSILKFRDKNKAPPFRIVVYRDGLGERFQTHVQNEIERMKLAFKELEAEFQREYNPQFAFVLVNKMTETRYASSKNGRYSNPNPGTVVEEAIVQTYNQPNLFDFFLVAQHVNDNSGTVSPVRYSVLHNTTGYVKDIIEHLTFKLTHMYYNWTGTVKVPAPCQYARKLAMMTGQVTEKAPHRHLVDKLYFL